MLCAIRRDRDPHRSAAMQKRADEYLSRLKVIVDHIRDSKERAT